MAKKEKKKDKNEKIGLRDIMRVFSQLLKSDFDLMSIGENNEKEVKVDDDYSIHKCVDGSGGVLDESLPRSV